MVLHSHSIERLSRKYIILTNTAKEKNLTQNEKKKERMTLFYLFLPVFSLSESSKETLSSASSWLVSFPNERLLNTFGNRFYWRTVVVKKNSLLFSDRLA